MMILQYIFHPPLVGVAVTDTLVAVIDAVAVDDGNEYGDIVSSVALVEIIVGYVNEDEVEKFGISEGGGPPIVTTLVTNAVEGAESMKIIVGNIEEDEIEIVWIPEGVGPSTVTTTVSKVVEGVYSTVSVY
jgi:hypothetical protein